MILEAIRNDSWQGVYNATAPNPVSACRLEGGGGSWWSNRWRLAAR